MVFLNVRCIEVYYGALQDDERSEASATRSIFWQTHQLYAVRNLYIKSRKIEKIEANQNAYFKPKPTYRGLIADLPRLLIG